jgi:hypothetical protein
MWSDADLWQFSVNGISFTYDLAEASGASDREARAVLAWGRVVAPTIRRDSTRQRGHPLSRALLDAGYERGHLVAYTAGGGMDANIFPQARHINRGWSPEGVRFVGLERLARSAEGAWLLHELTYEQVGPVPDRNRLIVVADGAWHEGTFANSPRPEDRKS